MLARHNSLVFKAAPCQAPGPEHIVRLLEDLLIFHCAFLVQWELAKASTLVLTLPAWLQMSWGRPIGRSSRNLSWAVYSDPIERQVFLAYVFNA
jgi:hypothetical protein